MKRKAIILTTLLLSTVICRVHAVDVSHKYGVGFSSFIFDDGHTHDQLTATDSYDILSYCSVAAYLGHTRFLSEPNKRFYQGKEAQELIDLYDFHARLYDAGLGRFAGVDPQGQFSSPYAGMGNDPVMMVDPDGEFAFLAALPLIAKIGIGVGAGLGAYSGAKIAQQNGTSVLWGALGGFAIGATAGVAGVGLSTSVTASIGTGTGFFAGAAGGAAAGAISGFISGAGFTALSGGNFGDVLGAGFKGAAIGGLAGGAIGGVTKGIQAKKAGLDFWSGEGKLLGGQLVVQQYQEPITIDTKGDIFENPTGGEIRGLDPHGKGAYGASRGGSRPHLGLDIVGDPGQNVVSPVDGSATNFRGATGKKLPMVDIIPSKSNAGISKIRILYVNAPENVTAWRPYSVVAGQTSIGSIANLQALRHPLAITNHIHVQVLWKNLWVNPTPFFFNN